jgi:hypothetical protein
MISGCQIQYRKPAKVHSKFLTRGTLYIAVDKRRKNRQFILTGSVIPTRTTDMLTGTEYALQMKNGILVVPIGCLKD